MVDHAHMYYLHVFNQSDGSVGGTLWETTECEYIKNENEPKKGLF